MENQNCEIISRDTFTHGMIIQSELFSIELKEAIKDTIESTAGILTTAYGNDIEGMVNKIIQKYPVTDEQVIVASNVLNQIKLIEEINDLTLNIEIDEAPDDEIVISYLNDVGVSFISINKYGDSMVQFSGYKKDKNRWFFDYDSFDSENIVYHFLQC